MSQRSAAPAISNRIVQLFVDAAFQEVGTENLPHILELVNLSLSAIKSDSINNLNATQAAELYARFQQAVRLSYGRGARGILLRIGYRIWEGIMMQTNFLEKTELEVVRWLPVPARRRRVLELVAGRFREGGGAASVHTLDLDLLLVDHSGAAAYGQLSDDPICHVTLGIIQGALNWATGHEADVEEVACMATGAQACEFKLRLGGK
jgi:predicted hydrocarbon binding protein